MAVTAASLLTLLGVLTVLSGPAQAADEVWDPIEPVNRAIFGFNEVADKWVLGPVAKTWNFLLPDPVQNCISNAYANAMWPVNLTNHFLQGELQGGAHATGRFVVNTTAGIGGLFDVASNLGWERHDEDTGQTLGVWGLGAGPYLVMPLRGPSNLRDIAGASVDQALRIWPSFTNLETYWMIEAPGLINLRGQLDDQIEAGRETAIDYYSLVRNAYDQNRDASIANTTDTTEESADDLYYSDFE